MRYIAAVVLAAGLLVLSVSAFAAGPASDHDNVTVTLNNDAYIDVVAQGDVTVKSDDGTATGNATGTAAFKVWSNAAKADLAASVIDANDADALVLTAGAVSGTDVTAGVLAGPVAGSDVDVAFTVSGIGWLNQAGTDYEVGDVVLTATAQ